MKSDGRSGTKGGITLATTRVLRLDPQGLWIRLHSKRRFFAVLLGEQERSPGSLLQRQTRGPSEDLWLRKRSSAVRGLVRARKAHRVGGSSEENVHTCGWTRRIDPSCGRTAPLCWPGGRGDLLWRAEDPAVESAIAWIRGIRNTRGLRFERHVRADRSN